MISVERLKGVIALNIFAHQHFVWEPNNFRTVHFGKVEVMDPDTTFRITQWSLTSGSTKTVYTNSPSHKPRSY